MTIASNTRVPGEYSDVDDTGANTSLPAYILPLLIVATKLTEPAVWASGAKAVGVTVRPNAANGHWYVAIVAGSVGVSEPTWPTTAGGTVVDGTVTWKECQATAGMVAQNVQGRYYSPAAVGAAMGYGSIAHRMAIAAYRQFEQVQLSCIGLDADGSGVRATGTITVSGTATENGTAEIKIGVDKLAISWETDATAAQIAQKVVDAVWANPDLPVWATIAGAVVTLIAKCKGTPGNRIGKYNVSSTKHEPVITSVGAGASFAIVGMSGGANDPSMEDALTAVAAAEFKLIPHPYIDADSIADVAAYFGSEADVVNQKKGRAFMAVTSAMADATTVGASNYKRQHVAWVRKCRMSAFEVAAQYAAMVAAKGHPAIPLNNDELVGCDAPDISDRITWQEANDCLWAGVTPFMVGAGEKVRCVRAVTTYTLNASGGADPTWLDTTAIACMDFNRETFHSYDTATYAGKVVKAVRADNDPSFVVTPKDIDSGHIAKAIQLETYGTMAGVEAQKAKFVTTIDNSAVGRTNSDIPVELTQGLHIIANTFRLVRQA